MNADHFPTPDVDVDPVDPETLKDRIDAGEDVTLLNARMLYESLQERVLALPDDTLIGGAHFSDAAEPADDGTYTAPFCVGLRFSRCELDFAWAQRDIFQYSDSSPELNNIVYIAHNP